MRNDFACRCLNWSNGLPSTNKEYLYLKPGAGSTYVSNKRREKKIENLNFPIELKQSKTHS